MAHPVESCLQTMPKAPRAIPTPAAAPSQSRKVPTKPSKAPKTLKEILVDKMMHIVREMRYETAQHVERKRKSLLSIGTDEAADVDTSDFFTAFEAKVRGVVDAFEESTDPFLERLARLLGFWDEVFKRATALYGKGGFRSFTPQRAMEDLEAVVEALAYADEDDVSIVKEMFELTDAQRLDTAAERMEEWILALMRDADDLDGICEKITNKAIEIFFVLPQEDTDEDEDEDAESSKNE